MPDKQIIKRQSSEILADATTATEPKLRSPEPRNNADKPKLEGLDLRNSIALDSHTPWSRDRPSTLTFPDLSPKNILGVLYCLTKGSAGLCLGCEQNFRLANAADEGC